MAKKINRKRKLDLRQTIQQELNSMEVDLNNDKFDEKIESDKSKRLEYLLQKTSLYAHFILNKTKNDTSMEKTKTKIKQSSKKKSKYDENENCDHIYTISPSFINNGEMRDYQIEGLNWLISLYENGINGILADEMGLGKTLQTISMFGYLKTIQKINGPFLVIVPKSTISNWINEIKRWCPSLKAFALIGTIDERKHLIKNVLLNRKKWDVCVTTYEICFRCKLNLKEIKWHYLVVDEAHRIKNENSLISKTVREFQSINRLLITGTPLHNNLHELWALLNFLLPDIFDSSDDFDSWFDTFHCLENEDQSKKLQSILKPFMLQRLKQDVEKSLLPKKEIKIYVGLSELQRKWYKKLLLKNIDVINGAGISKKMVLNNLIIHLMKCASHPYIIHGAEPQPFINGEHLVNNSGKMIILDKLLKKLKEQGSRVVIFCTFLNLLDILEDYCYMRNYKYFRMDGNTTYEQREKNIEEFNGDGSDIFLYIVSTTAGGLGINLQTADVAILLQSNWNPQIDLQAIDRVHRIGQKKQVRVFRIISEDTIEEKLIERAEIKLLLNEIVIQDENKSYQLETNEMKEIIRFGIDKMLSSGTSLEITDEDINTILERCEENTLGSFRLEQNNNLNNSKMKNFNLEKYHEVDYVYDFEGENYRNKTDLNNVTQFLQLPKRSCRTKIY